MVVFSMLGCVSLIVYFSTAAYTQSHKQSTNSSLFSGYSNIWAFILSSLHDGSLTSMPDQQIWWWSNQGGHLGRVCWWVSGVLSYNNIYSRAQCFWTGAGSVLQHIVADNGDTWPLLFHMAITSSIFLLSQYAFNDPFIEVTMYLHYLAHVNIILLAIILWSCQWNRVCNGFMP